MTTMATIKPTEKKSSSRESVVNSTIMGCMLLHLVRMENYILILAMKERRLKIKMVKLVRDQDGDVIDHKKYKQGMVFRCDPDGSNVECLGHNFRNKYEVAVDSYGSLWQSDNDDDGNRGTRINYVMDYGNYGFTDEMTGAGWQSNRTNIEDSIPFRHWHLNDPGVVPNLLQTGAGSPTGMLFMKDLYCLPEFSEPDDPLRSGS